MKRIVWLLVICGLVFTACARTVRLHPTRYADVGASGKIPKKVALIIPIAENKRLYTYNAWWVGQSYHVNVGETLEKLSMETLNSLYKEVLLMRGEEHPSDCDLMVRPEVAYYRYSRPFSINFFVPYGVTTLQVRFKVEDPSKNTLLDQTYNGSERGTSLLYFDQLKHVEDQGEKTFEYVFGLIASDLKNLKDKQTSGSTEGGQRP